MRCGGGGKRLEEIWEVEGKREKKNRKVVGSWRIPGLIAVEGLWRVVISCGVPSISRCTAVYFMQFSDSSDRDSGLIYYSIFYTRLGIHFL